MVRLVVLALIAAVGAGPPVSEGAEPPLREARRLMRQHKTVDAEAALVALLPELDTPPVRLLLARAQLANGACDAGIETVAGLRSRLDVKVLQAAATCYGRQADWAEALYWQEELALLKDAPTVRVTRALFHARMGDYDAADALLSEIEGNAPEWRRRWVVEAGLAVEYGQVDEAERLLTALEVDGDESLRVLLLRGQLALDAGDPVLAQMILDEALTQTDRDGRTLALAAEAYRRLGWLDQAQSLLDRRLSVDDKPSMRLVAARVAWDRGDAREARRLLALVEDPDAPDAVATAWYCSQGAERERLAARYAVVQVNPSRTLDQLL
jgi:tetratricopeptide (TPR) repeat protein